MKPRDTDKPQPVCPLLTLKETNTGTHGCVKSIAYMKLIE